MTVSNVDKIERKGLIFNVQKYNMYDGPGVRTLVFFKGCPLRCKWCSNPESQSRKAQILFKKNLCTNCGRCVPVCPVGIHSIGMDRTHSISRNVDCIGCGECVRVCLDSALSVVGEAKTVSEVLDIIEEDRAFYEMSGGGVTLGGGEVLMQPEFALNVLMGCKQRGINTAIETCGYTKRETILKIAEFTDLFLFDLKHINSERHYELTGVRNEWILENFTALIQGRFNVQARLPLMKGVNDAEEDIEQLIAFLQRFRDRKNFKGVDLLPYHKMGVGKYSQLDAEYPVKEDLSLSDAELERIENQFKRRGFPVAIIKH
ncbi:choline TMA-lyase-activating enzyme [Halodesulfovibrio aestuarii]|uniref:choline TMA-lyase-activating enzyme n=1 Tax=Halodesulfovibrio aestuarii TaxID=126333 RepID=UPI00351FE3E2